MAARKFVTRTDKIAGTAWPSAAESTVITNRAANAAENTSKGGYFIAIKAATRKVLSPISEKMIMVKARRKEWRGCIRAVSEDILSPRASDCLTARGSFFEPPAGDG